MTRQVAGIHYVTDERLSDDALRATVDAAVRAGVSVVQLRAKNVNARQLAQQAQRISDVIDGRAIFLINDRLDVALAVRDSGFRVDGVHLGQSDVPPQVARRYLGPEAIIGWTASAPEHLAAAHAMPDGGLDYLGVGVFRATSTKPDHPPVLGADGIAAVAKATTLPCIAIGGIGAADVAALTRAGVAGIAVVSAISAADDPYASATALVGAWTNDRESAS